MITGCTSNEGFEISPRFRRTIEERRPHSQTDAPGGSAAVGGASHEALPRSGKNQAAATTDRAVKPNRLPAVSATHLVVHSLLKSNVIGSEISADITLCASCG